MGVFMSPDNMLVVITSLGFAAVFLALIMAMTDSDTEELVHAVANMAPGARRQAKFERLDEMTRLADEAIEARRLGKRINADPQF
jgi:hypothetical protein